MLGDDTGMKIVAFSAEVDNVIVLHCALFRNDCIKNCCSFVYSERLSRIE